MNFERSWALLLLLLPLAWLAGKRLGGEKAAWAAMLLVATSPFAVRYSTETRMYSLVALLTVLGFLAVDRALRSPRPGNLVAVGAVAGLLLYSHYWSAAAPSCPGCPRSCSSPSTPGPRGRPRPRSPPW